MDGLMRLSGKLAIVTGSAVGLGRAVAARFAQEGAAVVAVDTNAAEGSALVERIRQDGGCAIFVRADIAQESEVIAVLKAASTEFKRIDVLYNNAAVLFHDRDARAHELSLQTWDQTMGVNLRGTFLCSKHVIPFMLKQGGGSIINLGSPTGLIGCAPNLTAYSASKAGVLGLTRVMAAAYARDGIRVNAVVPGTMDTPMNDYLLLDEKKREEFRLAVPMGRLGTPTDIAGLAVFLASDDSSYCTGGFFTCDGGLTAV
jgi:meso-butanediol dehydrogenase / (S,S)-butanediol dehydrogenase / diacetyl reductase